MLCVLKASPHLLLAGTALLGLISTQVISTAGPPAPHPVHPAALEAQYRGCDLAGLCWFWIESPDHLHEPLHRVLPAGVLRIHGDEATAIAVRDRLNALLASMIHQHKLIVLHNLREVEDGIFAATVTANGQALESDPVLLELREALTGTNQ